MSEQTTAIDRLTAGFYSVGEVRRLIGTPDAVTRRFVGSYKGVHGLWGGQDQRIGGGFYLTFRDLIEMRHVRAFHACGVSWQKIVEAARYARTRYESEYPFSDLRFKTDGAHVFSTVDEGLEKVPGRGQMAFRQVLGDYLFEPLDYKGYEPIRWYPAHEWGMTEVHRNVVVDPRFAFGAPVLSAYHIPTSTLYLNYLAESEQPETVAANYQVPVRLVICAVAFQRELERRHTAPV